MPSNLHCSTRRILSSPYCSVHFPFHSCLPPNSSPLAGPRPLLRLLKRHRPRWRSRFRRGIRRPFRARIRLSGAAPRAPRTARSWWRRRRIWRRKRAHRPLPLICSSIQNWLPTTGTTYCRRGDQKPLPKPPNHPQNHQQSSVGQPEWSCRLIIIYPRARNKDRSLLIFRNGRMIERNEETAFRISNSNHHNDRDRLFIVAVLYCTYSRSSWGSLHPIPMSHVIASLLLQSYIHFSRVSQSFLLLHNLLLLFHLHLLFFPRGFFILHILSTTKPVEIVWKMKKRRYFELYFSHSKYPRDPPPFCVWT